jgi:hypothetical protein
MTERNEPHQTVRSLVESVAQPWLVWTDEPLDLVSRVFWQTDN